MNWENVGKSLHIKLGEDWFKKILHFTMYTAAELNMEHK